MSPHPHDAYAIQLGDMTFCLVCFEDEIDRILESDDSDEAVRYLLRSAAVPAQCSKCRKVLCADVRIDGQGEL